MNRLKQQLAPGSRNGVSQSGLTAAVAALLVAASATIAHGGEAAPIKIKRMPGGISPQPVVTSISGKTNGVELNWQSFGRQLPPRSNEVVYTVLKCPALNGTNSSWTPVVSVTNATTTTAPVDGDVGFVQVRQEPAPLYAGADKCALCHFYTHDDWTTSRHANALESLKKIGMDKNPSCLPCHTVGFGTPNGYKDEATTPQLAGVQCENCHGPAYGHAAAPLDRNNKLDLSVLPVRTPSAEMCGGCHTDAHHPTYDEWAGSAHGTTVIPEEEFADPVSGPGRMLTCGACHSAATRQALLQTALSYPNPDDFAKNITNNLPSTELAATTGITCVACHDPHMKTGQEAQLLFPLASKIPYSYTTSKNFAANYNPDVQVCAQCHNDRGASWTGTSRPPHHSPQYNILIGSGGYVGDATNVPQSAHMDLEGQCAQCHTHPHSPPAVTESSPNYMGHGFEPTMQACAPCHDEVGAALITEAVQDNTRKQIAEIKGLLDQWALTKAPDDLRQKYGALAWEFQNIGQLSTRTEAVPSGPNATEQKAVPDAIKQARYNLYLVEHDHSYGVHNGNYTRFLLTVARNLVNAQLQAQ